MMPTREQVQELTRELREIEGIGEDDLPQVRDRLLALRERASTPASPRRSSASRRSRRPSLPSPAPSSSTPSTRRWAASS
jgi:hypothetical protein